MFKHWINKITQEKGPAFVALGFVLIMAMLFLGAVFTMKIDAAKAANQKTNPYTTSYDPTKTGVAGDNVRIEQFEEDNESVKKFVDLCNQKKFEEAYNTITPECRETLYPTVEAFIKYYCNKIFKTEKLYSLQAWLNFDDYVVYKISYIDDVLATGNYTDGEKYDDFITVYKNHDKISINKYIGRQNIFKEAKTKELEILVKTKDVFLENERYTLEIKNKTDKDILLDSMERINANVLLTLQSGAKVGVNKYEVNLVDMLVHSNSIKELTLVFRNSYGTEYSGSQLEFNDIILDRNKYIEEKDNYQDRQKISISFN